MRRPDKATCEVWIDSKWQLMPLVEAHAQHRTAEKRCPVCHGRVHTQGSYSAKATVAMTHKRAHEGCSRIPKLYAGTPKPHPLALD